MQLRCTPVTFYSYVTFNDDVLMYSLAASRCDGNGTLTLQKKLVLTTFFPCQELQQIT